jgi:hypothetical protein
MSDANREFYTDPDRIAEGFLNESLLWHPQIDDPDEWKYLDPSKADYTLRNCRILLAS